MQPEVATTYGRRYLLLMIFNIVLTDSDDDGNRAGGSNGNGPAPGPITRNNWQN